MDDFRKAYHIKTQENAVNKLKDLNFYEKTLLIARL